MTKNDILNFLSENKNYLQKHFYVDTIGLFGSYARDEATNKSDIDLVITSKVKNFSNRYKLKEYLETNLKKSVDIGYFDSLRTYIKNEIKDEIVYV